MAYTLACLLKQTESSLARNLLGIYVGCHTLARSLTSETARAHARTRRHATLSTLTHFCHFASMAQEDFAPEQQALHQQAQPYQQHKQQPEQHFPHQTLNIAYVLPQRSQTGFKKTFYKRKLPCPPAIEFSSPEGRQLFQEALLSSHMVGFFKLMEQFNTQDEPAFCGLASLAMVLNALSIDPRRTWKGSWRWFHEAMLDCCRPLDVVKAEGITLFQASCLARCNGARVELRPYGTTSLEQFRSEVAAVCRSGEEHIVVSYSRKAFLQTGDGHFSPIGGYHPERDLVLVLDVARFKYPPHWVPLPLLYSAMSYIDPETGRPRGYMRLASNPLLDSVLLTLDVRSEGWRPADAFVRQGAPELVQVLAAQGGLSGEDVVRRVIDAMPLDALDAFLVVRSGAPLAGAATAGPGSGTTTGSGGVGGTAVAPATELTSAAEGAVDGSNSCDSFLRATGPVCGTPESMAAAVRHASEVGNAAAAAVAAAAAGPPSSPTPSAAALHTRTSTQPGPAPSSKPLQGSPNPLPDLRLVPPRRKTCGGGSSGKNCGSNSCSSAHGGTSSGGPSGVADVSGSSCSSSCSSVMAAATAVFTAQDRCIPLAQRQQLLDELRGMPLFTLVASHLAAREAEADSSRGCTAMDPGPSAGPSTAHSCSTLPPPPPVSSSQWVTSSPPPPLPQHETTSPPPPQQPHSPPPSDRYLAEKVVMALLVHRPDVWPSEGEWRDPAVGAQWRALLGCGGYSVVEAEASYLREQLVHIDEVLQSGDFNGTCGEHSSRLDCAAHGH